MWTEARGLIQPALLALPVVGLMALMIPPATGYLFGPPQPGHVPSVLNVILAGSFPSWELARFLEGRRRSSRPPSVFTPADAGMMCVLATLLNSAVLEAATMLWWQGELRVRFPYPALVPFLFVALFVVVPIGALVGGLGRLMLRLVPHHGVDRPE